MREINLASNIAKKRKEVGKTQDELADYIGVSKASVSKWETGQSYPDITFLPQLASYFNISIDELMGYSPQMTKDEIKTLYHKLTDKFTRLPFDSCMVECRAVIKKYHSCFPLLFQMAVLLVNHHMLSDSEEKRCNILNEAVALCGRIKTESGDVRLSKDAVLLEASCYLVLGKPQLILDLLGETVIPVMNGDKLISQAHFMLGDAEKAKEIMQVSIYQQLLTLLDSLMGYCSVCISDNLDKAQEILNRALLVADAFDIGKLCPNTNLMLDIYGAHICCIKGQKDKAVAFLEKYCDICINEFFPFKVRGDSFFDRMDGWLAELALGTGAPRSEKFIKESMLKDVLLNPMFASLADEQGYKNVVKRFENFIGGV